MTRATNNGRQDSAVAGDESPTVVILQFWRDRIMANEPTVRLQPESSQPIEPPVTPGSAADLVERAARRFGFGPADFRRNRPPR